MNYPAVFQVLIFFGRDLPYNAAIICPFWDLQPFSQAMQPKSIALRIQPNNKS